MSLKQLRDTWNELAERDAFDAVLTRGTRARQAWDPETFFRTGLEDIEFIVRRIRSLGVSIGTARALDFGCGVGRLTQALCRHFQRVDGVDISAAMITRARSFNRFGDRCEYHLNDSTDLHRFPDCTFDFVYSVITLQHMAPHYSRRYIEEFFRIVRPGGVVVFQLAGESLLTTRPGTRSSMPLPPRACHAAIEAPRRVHCAPGACLRLVVTVRNLGSQQWPAMAENGGDYSIRLGNHWRRWWRGILRFDDRRAVLPHDVGAGESAVLELAVEAPPRPGTYILELDMVQEEVRWFAEVGSRPARVRVRVDASLAPGEVKGLPAQMEMHGIMRTEVEALIASCAGVLLAVDDDDAPGPAWTSHRYYARR